MRRQRTHAALVGAAQRVMGRKAFHTATIADITAEAGVAKGHFYNHFQSKEAVTLAAAHDYMLRLLDRLDAVLADKEDPAEEQAAAHAFAMQSSLEDPTLGWFVIQNPIVMDFMETSLRPRLTENMEKGVRMGRFDILDVNVATSVVIRATLSTVAAILKGEVEEAAVADVISMLLAMVGVPLAEARNIAANATAARRIDETAASVVC